MTVSALSAIIAADSISVLTPLLQTLREVQRELPVGGRGSNVHKVARQLEAQGMALAARVGALAPGQTAAPAPTPSLEIPPADSAWWKARLSWLASLFRNSVDLLSADATSKAVVLRALGQVELASFDLDLRPA